jgi:hypothetical protein
MSIYRTVLQDGVTFDCRGHVSTLHGSLVFFTFIRGKSKFKFTRTNRPIEKVLEGLPQRAFSGNLSGVIFEGKNVVREGNKLIIVKGDNSSAAWSRAQAIRDAREEVASIAGWE